ncbi:HAD family hydrolase [Polyangium jinanense]|uniref:HAD family phosphatase n=1 Tax=Polyangium jinanense TaxID=2829994 RepID=A0A9X4AX13_9BACT|nr:HAD family phosphatase [Polyangium jinanense]MDC3961573.1 HAD family phosphatase [Polyangium jinanense]MDC3987938.1 HAD family phosphatase [Polyangium jinanense]
MTPAKAECLADAHELLTTVRPAACVFDFDGTLVDTCTINTDAARATLAELGLAVPEPWLREAPLADLTALRHWLRAELSLSLPCTDAEFVARARSHWLARTSLVRPVTRVTALARHLAAAVPTAVASANDGQVVRAGLAAVGLADLFHVLVAREHVTRLKPAPDAYLLAAAQLAVAPHRCLAFENTDEGVSAARAAGMPVIDVRHSDWTVQGPPRRAAT